MVLEDITVRLPRETATVLRQMAAAQGVGLGQYICARLTRSAEVFAELMNDKGEQDDTSK